MAKITIVGAGLSGMVAALNLARQDYEVLVLEKEKQIGGTPEYHPSLHATPIDLRYSSDFTGIDLFPCFQLLTDFHTWIRNKRIHASLNNYGVERGARDSSIDVYLYNLCREAGVQFQFDHAVKNLAELPPGSIVATGLMRTVSDFQGHKSISGHGHSFVMESKIGPASWQYSDEYSPDYFYSVAMNGIHYGLLFGRRQKIEEQWIEVVNRQFYEREGIELKNWRPFSCEVMLGNQLFYGPGNRYILTGSASGSFDVFFGFGIVGALTSGKISALAVRDPEGAQVLFHKINRNYMFLYYLFELLCKIPQPLKWGLYQILPDYYRFLKPIFGRIGHGIPGYPRDWVEEFTQE